MKTVSRRYYHSSSFKMATLFTVLLGLAALLLSYFLYDFGTQNFTRETEALIDNEMEHILSTVKEKNTPEIAQYIAKQSKQQKHPIYLLYDQSGKFLAGNISQPPSKIRRIKEGLLSFTVRLGERQRDVASKIHTFPDGSRLLIARDIHLITQSFVKLQWITGLIIFFMLIVVSVSFFISIFVVGRINAIALTSQQIMTTGDLSQRISVDTSWDDLSNLAQILNTFLDRIENLMTGIRDVSDNIAHDLRTPLTRLRNDLEAAQNHHLDKTNLSNLLADADQMLATFNSLLRISNIEKGKRHHTRTPVQFATILKDVVELYDTLAEEKNITITTSLGVTPKVSGDRDLLFQLFANILDNAIKFSPETGNIKISLKQKAGQLQISISDQGPGINNKEKERVFDRLYRSDTSRNTPGNGLGLSLAKAVVEHHNASIYLEDNHPGLKVIIAF